MANFTTEVKSIKRIQWKFEDQTIQYFKLIAQ